MTWQMKVIEKPLHLASNNITIAARQVRAFEHLEGRNMNLFKKIKKEVDALDLLTTYIGPLKQCGDNTYTTEDDTCPIHGAHGCFRIKYDGENTIVNCFGSCDHSDWPVDVIEFIRILQGLETPMEAAKFIAEEFDIKMPVESANSRIMAEAQHYYSDMFWLSTKKTKGLGSNTPLEYQLNVRHHKKSSLESVNIGWSDGGLVEHLEDIFSQEELVASGIAREYRGELVDYIPADSFVYPHYVNGRVSRFSFKHRPSKGKKLTFQMKKCNWLNDIEFFMVGSGGPVAVVEGEDDLVSMLDEAWEGTILCSNGSFSSSQADWIAANPEEYHTFWDGDAAGDKYTEKMWKLLATGKLKVLHQWALPENTDIDDYLKGHSLAELHEKEEPDREDLINVIERSNNNVLEEAGCYKVCAVNRDGDQETRIPITDFTIELLYVKVQGDERSRVIRIIRNDGRKSKPIVVNSEAKVSIRHWKILVANAVDASFTGSEQDLAAMWTYIYNRQREAVVDVPNYVGDLEGDGWLFGNQYIGHKGDVEGDKDNIMWLDREKTKGVAPKSLMAALSNNSKASDIPNVWKGENTIEFINEVSRNLNMILKDEGLVLAIMGWLRSCSYSMPLFHEANLKFFPFLLLWGRHGRGKSTLANWMLSMYDMADKGTTTVGQLRSGVGIERKLAYYRGLPYCIDELRADRQASEYSRTWRGWYNRSSRVKGTRKSEDIIQVPLNACLFFSGQDTFTDPAMRSRCIPCKFPVNAGDTQAYNWLEDEIDDFPTIGYHWIRESMGRDIVKVKREIDDFRDELKEICPDGIPSRSIYNYALIGYFSKELAEECFPEFDYMGWLVNAMNSEQVEANDNDMVFNFWNSVAGLQIGDRPALNGNHIMIKNDVMYIWYAEVFKAVHDSARGEAREAFSRGAVRDALIDEKYYAGDATQRLGPTNTNRRCLSFDLKHKSVPQELLAVAETAHNSF